MEAFKKNGLKMHDVFLSLIHGGSIVFVGSHESSERVESQPIGLGTVQDLNGE